MHIGAAMFFTDYSMAPGELATALEERGFESLWSPEHSHIPMSRKSPFPSGGDLPKKYYDAMDPFVALTAAAAVTKTLKVGTGICLIAHGSSEAKSIRAALKQCRTFVRAGINDAVVRRIEEVAKLAPELTKVGI